MPGSPYSPQTRGKLRRGVVLLTIFLVCIFWTLSSTGALDWLENRTSDWRVRASVSPATASRDIVVIDIDNFSFRELTEKLGRWPWTRRVWTELVRYLTPGHPKLILFDALFSGAEPQVDEEFASTMAKAGNVVLPFAFVSGRIETDSDIFTPPPQSQVRLAGASRGPEKTRAEWSLNAPHAVLAKSIGGTGSNLWTPDPDGITRRLPLLARYEGREYATVWLAAAMTLSGISEGPGAAARFEGSHFTSGPIRLPVDSDGNYVVRWYADPLTAYRQIPLHQMICSIYPSQCDEKVVKHPPSEFRNKIVFIGASAAGSYEVRPTAVSESAPGVFILATALDNLLHNDAIRRLPQAAVYGLILLLTAMPAWSVLQYRSLFMHLAVSIGVAAAYGILCFVFYRHSVWLPMAAPVLAAAVSFTGNAALRYLIVDRELSRTRGTLERYVAPQLVRYVMDNLESFRFDGEKKRLTVFFSDVRNFTTLTEKSDPVRLLRQLNEYLEAMTDIIFRYEGIVDKFIGDGIMAHWGAFTPDHPNALLAAQAALAQMAKLEELNKHWEATGYPRLDIGIGINTGDVIFGNVGSRKKFDFTAIGDGVNLAARLEGANKEYNTHIIVSESTRRELGSAADVRSLGSIVVKGKTVGVEIYELRGLAS
ncbi:MAG: adenylate/guanylate cyclase domain-containing protein [Bryobacteraceae bacterium]